MQPITSVTVTNKRNRGVLSEGRAEGMAFALCKEVSPGNYTTVQPLSPCKDYLNDVIWAEVNNKEIKACGLVCVKEDIYKDGLAFLAINMLQYNKKELTGKPHDVKRLHDHIGNIVDLINHVEISLGVTPLTTVAVIEPGGEINDGYLLTLSQKWCTATAAISLYSLIARIGLYYDGDTTPDIFMKAALDHTIKLPLDSSLWDVVYLKYVTFVEKKMFPDKLKLSEQPITNVHSNGIINYND